MTEETAPPFSPDPTGSPDFANPLFDFATTEWHALPKITTNDDDDDVKLPNLRLYFLDQFRKRTNPTDWHRYLTLGYFAYEDGQTFTVDWHNKTTTWLERHKIVWYNYMYHLDNSMDAPIKLHGWATKMAHPYLLKHEPKFLEIDTRDTSWRQIQEESLDDKGWNVVGGDKPQTSLQQAKTNSTTTQASADSLNRIRPPPVNDKIKAKAYDLSVLKTASNVPAKPPPVTKMGKNPLATTMGILNRRASTTLNNLKDKSAASIRTTWNLTNPDKPVPVQPPPIAASRSSTQQPEAMDMSIDHQSTTTFDSDGKQSAHRPYLNVPTNDGTQRITIRWTPEDKQLSHVSNPGKWTEAVLEMMQELFPDEQGLAYRWESQDLATWTPMSLMKPDEFRDYISPAITYISSMGLYVFGFRFGFTTRNPVSWKSQEVTKEVFRNRHVWATVHNSSCTSGDLVHAGYILMKAPNTTHQIRYLQHLRNRLPENTPFFDVVLAKRTPADQQIHHLVIECGENHVATLSKSISALLTGSDGAIFLPRVVLGNLTKEQISKYFTAHENYVKSLRTICMSPRITNLETIRDEYFENGEVIQRTTREWATSIQLTDGSPARCDIVNGGPDKVVNLLVPNHVYAEVIVEVAKYKQRLNPMERREARFRDTLPGLPDIIQIDISVQTSLDCLEMLAAETIWQRAPPAVRQAKKAIGNEFPPLRSEPNTQQPFAARPTHQAASASVLTDLTGGDSSASESEGSRNPQSGSKSSKPRKKNKKKKAKVTQASSTSADHTVDTTPSSQEFREMEKLLQAQQTQLDAGLAESSNRLGAVEEQLQALKRLDDMDVKIGKSMRQHANTNATLDQMQKQQDRMMLLIEGMAVSQQRLTQHPQQPGSIVITADGTNANQQGSISTLTAEAQIDNRLDSGNSNSTVPTPQSNQEVPDEDRSATTQDTASPGIFDSAWSSDLASATSGFSTQATGNELAIRNSPATTRARDKFQVLNPKQTKKQKSAHDAKVAINIVTPNGDTDVPGQLLLPEPPAVNEHQRFQDSTPEAMQPPRPETPTSIQAEQEFEDDEFSDDDMEFEDGDDASSMNTSTATANTDLDDQYNTKHDPDGGDSG